MELNITFINPITNIKDNFCIQYPYVDYFYWKYIKNTKFDKDIIEILEDILINLDCTKEIDCGRICTTNMPRYKNYLSDYYYYIIKFSNQLLYNKYIDKLIKRHIDNIIFEYNNPIIINNKQKVKRKRKIKNEYIKNTFKDLFSNDIKYLYANPFTKDEIISDDPNLLNILNNKKDNKKNNKKKIKSVGVPIELMTFSFKK